MVEHLGDPQAVLVVDETGDLEKGTRRVGVQRRYTGTAGRFDSAQVAVYLADATMAGHGVVDWELYLPKAGLTILHAAMPPGCLPSARLRPSLSWPG